MDSDFPASHSMDTCFFAVDRDGHVAVFDSGESGAVPERAFAGDDALDACEELALLPVRTAVLHDPRGHGAPHQASSHRRYPLGMFTGDVLTFLRSVDPVRDEIAAGRAVEVPAAGGGAAVLFREQSEALSRKLHEAGLCLGCYFHEVGGFADDLPARGLFGYWHGLTENWVSGPYGRLLVPAHPLRVDELPEPIRDEVGAMRFDFSFAETAHIQPVEHAECESWQPAWVDVAFRHIRPIPGREAEYARDYDYLVKLVAKTDQKDNAAERKLTLEPPA